MLDFERELKERNLGFSVYANLEDRDFSDEKGYDRYNDDVEVTKPNFKNNTSVFSKFFSEYKVAY